MVDIPPPQQQTTQAENITSRVTRSSMQTSPKEQSIVGEEKKAKKHIWKPDLKMLEKRALEQGKLVTIDKYYNRYAEADKLKIEDIVIVKEVYL